VGEYLEYNTMHIISKSAHNGANEYRRLKYNPSRGGHAPGHLRDEFENLVFKDSDTDDQQGRLEPLCGLLWNCSDIMPSGLCGYLDLPPGSAYAQGARYLKSAETPI
jgi:hypothetical protein